MAVLSPGDLIRIAVWRRPELSGDFQIALDGSIVHPLYRKIVATGVPMTELERRIRSFLLQFEATPEFVISPLFRIFVAGEVRQPSVLSVPPGTTLAHAIALSGGPTEDSRLDRVRLTRGLVPRMFDLTSGDQTTAQFELGSSDQIVVGRRTLFVRDRLMPTASVIAALASVVGVVLLSRR